MHLSHCIYVRYFCNQDKMHAICTEKFSVSMVNGKWIGNGEATYNFIRLLRGIQSSGPLLSNNWNLPSNVQDKVQKLFLDVIQCAGPVLQSFFYFVDYLSPHKERVQNPQSRKKSVRGGGDPPFPLTFFRWVFWNRPSEPKGEGGYPPFPFFH